MVNLIGKRSRVPLRQGAERRRETGVAKVVVFKTKPYIAIEQIEAACQAGLPRGVVLIDAVPN
jgi:SRSO17 transposase